MALPWYEEEWSRGILLGLDADPNTGYRATVWFEYTRALFNEIREGSLIAVRDFSDRPKTKWAHKLSTAIAHTRSTASFKSTKFIPGTTPFRGPASAATLRLPWHQPRMQGSTGLNGMSRTVTMSLESVARLSLCGSHFDQTSNPTNFHMSSRTAPSRCLDLKRGYSALK
jgi:hypothetical protein